MKAKEMFKELERLSECVRNSSDEESLQLIKQALIEKDKQIKELQELNKGHQKTIELLTNERDIAFDKFDKIEEAIKEYHNGANGFSHTANIITIGKIKSITESK